MKIVSFGDSFVYGSEVTNNINGHGSWIGQAARKLDVDYETLSIPGCGNEAITRQIFSYFSDGNVKNTLAVVNWTWAARYDIYFTKNESWTTLGPTCVPRNLTGTVGSIEAQKLLEFYANYGGKSILWDRYRSLQTMYAAQCFLDSLGVKSIHTTIDMSIFNTEFHAPNYIQTMQNLVKSKIESFEGMSFLDWSYARGYPVSAGDLHPLNEAHAAACELWLERYAKELGC